MNEQDLFRAFKNNFPFYAARCLKIRTKDSSIVPFELNQAQKYIHDKLEEQLKLTGKVRAIILKGRQQGCSTYVAARYYHQVTHRVGTKVFILTHKDDATQNLYKLVHRYHNNVPPAIRAQTSVSNSSALIFPVLDSGYAVGTAGAGDVGRSDTIQLLHGSEAAFWKNTNEISSGIMQTVPDVKNTEIILESTANGIGNMYHKMAVAAMAGDSEYQLIFVPWYWQEEYRRELESDFVLTEEEREYKRQYKLDDKQIAWRRNKIANFAGGAWQFKQEYPATAVEAFQTSSDNSLITSESIMNARKAENVHIDDQLIIGVDPAWKGKDKTAIIFRAGRVQYKHELYSGLDTMQVVSRLIQIINHYKPEKVFIDVGGIGAGIYDRLKELRYTHIVTAINFGQKADQPERYLNKRAEMWDRMKEWLQAEPVKIEDSDALHADLQAPEYTFDSSSRLVLEKKDDIKKRYGKSPDLGDAFCLTFAYNLPSRALKARYGIGTTYQANSTWGVYD
jgi:hypothetical protein